MSAKRGGPAPAVVGSHFVKQYYGEVLSKKPVELHRFYKDESTFCHSSGTKEEEPVSGLAAIKAKIEHLGLGGAMVDLGCGSVDAQPSEGGGVLLMVTGSITISGMDPRQFCQTFFLARQYQDTDRHNYFVRNDIFRFLDVLPEVVQAALRTRDELEGSKACTGVSVEDAAVSTEDKGVGMESEVDMGMGVTEDSAGGAAAAVEGGLADADVTASSVPQACSPVVTPSVEPVTAPDSAPTPMAIGSAPPSESQVAASSAVASDPDVVELSAGNDGSAGAGAVAAAADLDNGTVAKVPVGKMALPSTGVSAKVVPETAAPVLSSPASPVQQQQQQSPQASLPPPPAQQQPVAAPVAPPVTTTYAAIAKSWANVAAVGGDTPAPLSIAGSAPASSSSSSTSAGANSAAIAAAVSGNGVVATPASNGGWGIPDATAVAALGSGIGMSVDKASSPSGGSVGGGQGSSRSSSSAGKGQKGSLPHVPHHASPAVAASAAAAREAAAAGNGEIFPATSLFVRKVDMTIDKEEMIAHFSNYGDVTGISMNPTRGYAFIDYRSNECVQRALSTKDHYVNRKLLVVEERHSPMIPRNSRDHSGRGGRNGPRGRGPGGRDSRDGDRSDRRSSGARGGRGGMGRGDRPEPKEGGYKPRGRPMPA